ncbi:hypothetical protein ONZ51_g3183 [Trametes cubensis]|uniref:Uncharacterized protein n=1 Tax=Trametes cubensis TaxID=1111947 RepID=A0AAD7TYQ9_9APHY|nr:hypothetical protein ONZ51_g3183 [Trametes cubensis]
MVEHFNDPIATAEAQTLKTKKHLVYLDSNLDLPFPTDFWYRYEISPIGTTPRPEDPAHGITADMVIPIFPNTHHPRDRPPIRPETPFPFPNCYHWIENDATVRIRRKDEQYDDTNAVELSAMQHVMIDIGFSDDYKRIDDFLDGQAEGDEGTAGIDDGAATIPSPAPTPPRAVSRASQPSRLSAHSGRAASRSEDTDSLPEGEIAKAHANPSLHDEGKCDPTVADIYRMDIFGLSHDDSAELLPLVDLWYELTEHLSADTIPSPLEFYKERDAIARIIHAARLRSPNVPTPLRNPDRLSIMSDDLSQVSAYSFDYPPPGPAPPVGDDTKPDRKSIDNGALWHERANRLHQDDFDGRGAHSAKPLPPASNADIQKPAHVGIWTRIRKRALAVIFFRRPPWSMQPPLLPYFP